MIEVDKFPVTEIDVVEAQEKFLPLSSATKFNLYEREQIDVAVGDRIRVSKNFQSGGRTFRNNELLTVTGVEPQWGGVSRLAMSVHFSNLFQSLFSH